MGGGWFLNSLGPSCSGQHWAIHFLSQARTAGKQPSLFHHRAILTPAWERGLGGGRGSVEEGSH